MEVLYVEISNNLKNIRMTKYKMDRPEFAKMLEIKPNTYYRYEFNMSFPSMREGLRIALILNLTIGEIWYLS